MKIFIVAAGMLLALAGCGGGVDSPETGLTEISPSTLPTARPNTGPPVLSPAISGITTNATTFSVAIDKDGTGYYLIQRADVPAPTASAVIAAGHGFAMSASTLAAVNVSGLQAGTAYQIYFAAVDKSGNAQSSPASVAMTTLSLPATTAGPVVLGVSNNGMNFSVTVDGDGTGYYLVQPAMQPAPTVGALLAANASFAMRANSPSKLTVNGLNANTAYVVYFVAKNVWGDSQASVSSQAFTTSSDGVLPHGYIYQGGLVWMPAMSHSSWVGAKAYCAAFNGLGLSGWRQPSSTEAISVITSGAWRDQGWPLWGYLWTYESRPELGWPVMVDWRGLIFWSIDGGDAPDHYVACVH